MDSNRPLLLNGVALRQGRCRPGDRLHLGTLRLQLSTITPSVKGEPALREGRERRKTVKRGGSRRGWAAAAAVALTGLLLLLIPRWGEGRGDPYATLDLPRTAPQEKPEEGEDVSPRGETLMIAPGEPLPAVPVEVLFIHAHPDDETLDYGCFLAWCETQGLSVAVLLITDGEGGLDLYPRRLRTGLYPDGPLEGEELAAVRVVEAQRALSLAGVEFYLRWSLPNNPYNGLADEKTPAEILALWNGAAGEGIPLEERLARLLVRLKPRIVVSPDGPALPREHFEHEAVGLLTARTLALLGKGEERFGGYQPEVHLTVLDPRQAGFYDNPLVLDASWRPAPGELSLRDRQINALEMHQTQRDALVEGRSFLPPFPGEPYLLRRGDSDALGWPKP